MVQINEDKSNCTGCGACIDVCGRQCMSLNVDPDGFLYAHIDESGCTDCGQCDRVCPVLTKPSMEQFDQQVYAAWAKDQTVRNSGSSGGLFFLYAMKIIDAGGVVYGAAFDSSLKLKHTEASTKEDLYPLCKSKYLQSNANRIYQKVKKSVQSGKPILFVGAPCQVAALRNYLAHDYQNLLTMDFICHGVPSQIFFDQYIADIQKREKGKVTYFSFRHKIPRGNHIHIVHYKLRKSNNREVQRTRCYYDSAFEAAYLKRISYRMSCYQCQFATPDRYSDITLADFHGIHNVMPGARIEQGYSMIIINTAKGASSFQEIKESVSLMPTDMEVAKESNECLRTPTKMHANRSAFLKDLQTKPFSFVTKTYLIDGGLKRKIKTLLKKMLRRI